MSRWRWTAGTVVAAAVAVVSWSPPLDSAPPPVTPVAAPAAPEVSMAWRPGLPELGIHVYWEDNPLDTDDALRLKARRVVDQIVGMEANAIAISFPFFTEPAGAHALLTDPRTPSPERLGIVLEEARAVGLRTTIRPLLDQTKLNGWRGELAPSDRSAWYAQYRDFLEPYLLAADRDDVDTVAIAAELSEMQTDRQWNALVTWARSIYRGELAYSANWDAYPTAVAGIPVDRIDIDAYPFLGVYSDSNQLSMTRAWEDWLARTAPDNLDQLVLSEVGGAAESKMVDNPARADTPGAPLDEEIQRKWFAAACEAARNQRIAGLYWWKLDLYLDPVLANPATDRHDTWLGRPSEGAIRECFARWASPT